jgi:hypothetical protein
VLIKVSGVLEGESYNAPVNGVRRYRLDSSGSEYEPVTTSYKGGNGIKCPILTRITEVAEKLLAS